MGIRPTWPDFFFAGYFRRAVMDDNGVRIKETEESETQVLKFSELQKKKRPND